MKSRLMAAMFPFVIADLKGDYGTVLFGGADEAPQVCKCLPQVLVAHGD